MAVLVAYFDDSGSDRGAPHFIVGGYVARVSDWMALSESWQQSLGSWGLDWFHMASAERMDSNGPERRNEYGWDWRMRDERVRTLGEMIGSIGARGIACSLDRRLWTQHVKPALEQHARADRDFGYPYLMPYTGCLAHLGAICAERGVPLSDVEVYFAEQKHDGPRARETVRRVHANFGLRDPHFDSPQRSAPLQCADALAWLTNRSIREGSRFQLRARHEKFLKLLPHVLTLDERWLPRLGRMLSLAAATPGPVDLAALEQLMRDP